MSSTASEVVGWGTPGARWTAPGAGSLPRALCEALAALGVSQAFGILGGGIAPFAAGLAASPIRFFHFRHEAGAGFAALEASLALGAPTVAVVTTGPGLINLLNPLFAARLDGARLLVISGATPARQVGRGAVQESSLHNLPADLYRPGSIFHDALLAESAEAVGAFLGRLKRGFEQPGGFVAHLALPMNLQTLIVDGPFALPVSFPTLAPAPSVEALDATLAALDDPNAVLWLGSGARGAATAARRFAEAARMPVLCSPRAKGILSELHPLFAGVTGAGGSPAAGQHLRRHRPRWALVIGSRLGEVTTFLSDALLPSEGIVHVDIDPRAFGAAFPNQGGFGVVADATVFVELLHRRAEQTGWLQRRPREARVERPPMVPLLPRASGPVRPAALMAALQRQVVEGSEALVVSEAGTSFTWCNALLRFLQPGRYRTSAAWGSMGHFTTGAIGAALASDRPVVAVVGDGAMLMNNEINTAVQYGARVCWVILNDAQLGLNEQGMTALGMKPVETQMPRTDFVAFARSQGAAGFSAPDEASLPAALAAALAVNGPVVLDVTIDRSALSPVIAARVASLAAQGEG